MTNDDATPLYLPDELVQKYGPEAAASVHDIRTAPRHARAAPPGGTQPTTRSCRLCRQLVAAAVAILLIGWLPAAWVGVGVLLGLTIVMVHVVRCDSRTAQTVRARPLRPDEHGRP